MEDEGKQEVEEGKINGKEEEEDIRCKPSTNCMYILVVNECNFRPLQGWVNNRVGNFEGFF